MAIIQTINPSTGEAIQSYQEMSDDDIHQAITSASNAFYDWRKKSLDERSMLMLRVAKRLIANKLDYAKLITTEMGKPINQAVAEVKKCAWICEHYAEHAATYLQPMAIKTEMKKSTVYYQPKGTIFAIMPWNFPFWQVFRFAVPNLMAGNTVLLSHAPISTGAALAIEAIFSESGLPEGVFRSLIISIDQASQVIADPRIMGVTLTGSDRAGRSVASQAGQSLKKSVLELGGSDPYLILHDADIEYAAATCVNARLMVSGQVCISPKRIIVVDDVYDQFEQKVLDLVQRYQPGDPLEEQCNLGPLARSDLRDHLADQVDRSIAQGAVCLYGGKPIEGPGFYYLPTILTQINPGMPAYDEELFGPVICLIRVKDEAEAITVANDTVYGLGAAVFTRDEERGQKIAVDKLDAGVCSVNTFVASDPRLPFGGTKQFYGAVG